MCIIQRATSPRPATSLLFDVRGEAVYPTWDARYRRMLNVIALAG
jgi:hypothetical protein